MSAQISPELLEIIGFERNTTTGNLEAQDCRVVVTMAGTHATVAIMLPSGHRINVTLHPDDIAEPAAHQRQRPH